MLFERVETATPELTIGGKPPIHVGERLGPQPVPAPLALSAHTHDTGVAQDAQMLRHPRLADREPVDQLADGPFAVTEQVENPPALRVREDVESGVHTRRLLHSYISSKRYSLHRNGVGRSSPCAPPPP